MKLLSKIISVIILQIMLLIPILDLFIVAGIIKAAEVGDYDRV